jgi:hypothetical protein
MAGTPELEAITAAAIAADKILFHVFDSALEQQPSLVFDESLISKFERELSCRRLNRYL